MIPILNIYYLLCYAWDALDEKDKVNIKAENYTNVIDLLAKVLVNATNVLLKRGLHKQYIDYTGLVPGIKGKLQYSETLKQQLFVQGKTICAYDEFSENIVMNQVLVTTLHRLMNTDGLDRDLARQTYALRTALAEIDMIQLSPRVFNNMVFSRNTRLYKLLMHVCRLLFDNMLPSEEPGSYQFSDFTRDKHQMNRLFERFIRNFYRREQDVYSEVKSEYIDWKLETTDAASKDFLPLMKTDISLHSDTASIIIDAKFYQETVVIHYKKEKIHSGNLYQLFSYLINQRDDREHSYEATGILVYPTTDTEYDLDYVFEKHPIKIRTLNLHANWKQISKRLLEIIDL